MTNILEVSWEELLKWSRAESHATYVFVRTRKRTPHVEVTVLLQEAHSKKGAERYKEWRKAVLTFVQYEQFVHACEQVNATIYAEGGLL